MNWRHLQKLESFAHRISESHMQFVGDTLDDILKKAIERLLKSRGKVEASRGENRELVGVNIRLNNPLARLSHTEGKGKVFSAIGELLWYLAGTDKLRFIEHYLPHYGNDNSDDGKTVHGAYGPRFFKARGEINQIENVLSLLRAKPQSRRAVIQLFDAADINGTFKEIPCTCTLQFLNRKNKLDLVVSMRSNDAFLGFSHDVFAFTMLQEIFARSLGLELGKYHHFVGSLHLYDKDERRAKQFVDEGWQPTVDVQMDCMPTGDPWIAIRELKKVESRLRNSKKGKPFDLANYKLAPYWQDLARLLEILRAVKDKDKKEIARIRGDMASRVFDEYIEFKEHKAPNVRPRSQLKLFSSQKTSRTAVPSWLSDITKNILANRKKETDDLLDVIPWSSPVPFFGDITQAVVATLAVNPSNLEFVDKNGNELAEPKRRLETLKSLGIVDWNKTKAGHFKQINHSAIHYFDNNPYNTWFKPLEQILLGANVSFYGRKENFAAHVDLIPFATQKKWTSLSSSQQQQLLEQYVNSLAGLLKHAPVKCLILNGMTVVKTLEKLSGIVLKRRSVNNWGLPRKSVGEVKGYSFEGKVSKMGDVSLEKEIKVFGFNHNLQSSYGVTAEVKSNIKDWLVRMLNGELHEK